MYIVLYLRWHSHVINYLTYSFSHADLKICSPGVRFSFANAASGNFPKSRKIRMPKHCIRIDSSRGKFAPKNFPSGTAGALIALGIFPTRLFRVVNFCGIIQLEGGSRFDLFFNAFRKLSHSFFSPKKYVRVDKKGSVKKRRRRGWESSDFLLVRFGNSALWRSLGISRISPKLWLGRTPPLHYFYLCLVFICRRCYFCGSVERQPWPPLHVIFIQSSRRRFMQLDCIRILLMFVQMVLHS